MLNYQAVSKSTHMHLRWKRHNTYHFATLDAVVPLVVEELTKACMAMPLAFIEQNSYFIPAAVQGLQPGQNLFVTPDGRWIGPYTPAAYRAYPFALATAENNQLVLCVDADSGLVSEEYTERFFDDSGEPSESIQSVMNFLQQVRQNRQRTKHLCAALAAEGLIQPWPITVKTDSGEQSVQGLYRIDEAKLNSLDADALYRVHQSGALPMAYCQLLSMQHLQALGKLAEAHAQAKAKTQSPLPTIPSGELDLSFLNNGGTLSFGAL